MSKNVIKYKMSSEDSSDSDTPTTLETKPKIRAETDCADVSKNTCGEARITVKKETESTSALKIEETSNSSVNSESSKRMSAKKLARSRPAYEPPTNMSQLITSAITAGLNDYRSDYTPQVKKKKTGSFSLYVSNFPKDWTKVQVAEYIEEHCDDMQEIQEYDVQKDNTIHLTFDNLEECKGAKKTFDGKCIEEYPDQLSAYMSTSDGSESETDSEPEVKKRKESDEEKNDTKSKVDVWKTDPKGLYGLKPGFLKSLDITPPIGKWVHVSNFRCDKLELREALEMAGHVVICNMQFTPSRVAKVMYSHPLEAVQAISMFHNQTFYGQKLALKMDTSCPFRGAILPKGLSAIGQGLGAKGAGLRDIVKQYERHASGLTSEIEKGIFLEPGDKAVDTIYVKPPTMSLPPIRLIPKFPGPEVDIPLSYDPPRIPSIPTQDQRTLIGNTIHTIPGSNGSMNPPITPAHTSVPMVRMTQMRPVQIMPGQMGPMSGPNGPMPGPSRPIMPNVHCPTPSPVPSTCVACEITNLPLSTTFPVLSDKMAEVGQVMSLQLTAPGAALVQFAHPAQAEKCYQRYNGCTVMGNVLVVKLL